jgi:hypothetical protein
VALAGPGSAKPGSWGGHAVPIVAYDNGGLTCVTWGQRLRLSWDFFLCYFTEAYAVLSPDWFNQVGQAPSGFDQVSLMADLKAVTA